VGVIVLVPYPRKEVDGQTAIQRAKPDELLAAFTTFTLHASHGISPMSLGHLLQRGSSHTLFPCGEVLPTGLTTFFTVLFVHGYLQ